MKKIVRIVFLNIFFCLIFTISSFATTNYIIADKDYEYKGKDVTVKYNNEIIEFDVSPIIHNDRTLLPIRALVEKVDGIVEWDEKTKLIFISLEGIEIAMQIGNNMASVNGEKIKLDVAPCIAYENGNADLGRTVVPIRFVMENLGLKVDWDSKTYTVFVINDKEKIEDDEINNKKEEIENEKIDIDNKDNEKVEEIEKFEFTNTVEKVSFALNNNNVVVKIVTSKAMEYKISDFHNTERTVIDIMGAEFDCSQEQQVIDEGAIQKMRFGQGDKYARIVVDLNEFTIYTKTTNTAKTELYITYRLKKDLSEKEEFIVVLDPGHAAGTVGAYYGNIAEQEITADVVDRLLELFEKDKKVKVYSTQKEQLIPGLQDIANYANNLNADLFVSVHCNAAVDSKGNPLQTASGTETYYAVRELELADADDTVIVNTDKEYYGITSKQLAKYIQEGVLDNCGSNDRQIKERGTLAVLKYTNMPACLCELEFMTCNETLDNLKDEEYRQKCAQGIYDGIINAIEYMQKK